MLKRMALLGVVAVAASGCAVHPPVQDASPSPRVTPGASAPTAQGTPTPPPTQPTPTPSAATPAQPSASSTPTPTARRTVTIAASGDLLWHESLLRSIRADAKAMKSSQPEEYGPLFASVKPVLTSADVAICHNEVPIVPAGAKVTGYPSFGAPLSTVRALKDLGFDACTTASNHSLDRGFANLTHTLKVLREAGITPSGTASTPEEALAPPLVKTPDGVTVAIITGTYDLNGEPLAGKPWAVADLDPARMLKQAKAARAAGADIVIAVVHAGAEYVHKPTAQQVSLAKTLTASPDVDLVYGHHAHVVQPITKVNGKWVVYGVGNLVGQMRRNTPRAMEAIIARCTFTQQPSGRFTATALDYVPLAITYASPHENARVLVIKDALGKGRPDEAELRTKLAQVRRAVNALGVTGVKEA